MYSLKRNNQFSDVRVHSFNQHTKKQRCAQKFPDRYKELGKSAHVCKIRDTESFKGT